jgi:hypothetical protein
MQMIRLGNAERYEREEIVKPHCEYCNISVFDIRRHNKSRKHMAAVGAANMVPDDHNEY